jgi:glycyl-tRNA synthetase beta chain
MTTQNLLLELFVEELPPKALNKLGLAFASLLADGLKAQGLAALDAKVCDFASPRRLAVHVTGVLAQAPAKAVVQKLMPVAVGLDATGLATPALLKKLHSLGAQASAVAELQRAMDGKSEVLLLARNEAGVSLAEGLQKALDEALAKLPIPKVMSYQLERDCEFPGWSTVSFVRPAHGLMALHGADVIAVKALGLTSGNVTEGHRFEASMSPVRIAHADDYADTLLRDGTVIANFAARRLAIVNLLSGAAEKLGPGYQVLMDDALLLEVTGLVERPNVLMCSFDEEFLDVPQECLILTMQANQKYFPLLDGAGKLTSRFLVVSNISPTDPTAVIRGNERVVRPRLADAQFFFNQDRKKTLESRVEGLSKVVYHNKLGSQGERMARVRSIACSIAQQLGDAALVASVDTAARLAKTDLLTDMVGEFPELQGTMGAYYARHDGLGDAIATAIEDHYKPRFAGDALPRNLVGLTVALADKLETLVGMFGIGNLPTGDKDPFALRRHALGVVRMLMDRSLQINVRQLIEFGHASFMNGLIATQDELRPKLELFFQERIVGLLESEGHPFANVSAVLASPDLASWGEIRARLAAVRAFADLPESAALAAANKRIGNILKKAPEVDAHVSPVLLKEPAEIALYGAMQSVLPRAQTLFEGGDYTGSLQALAALRSPVDAFFDGVMVNAEEIDLRRNRQGLLKSLFAAMNRVADLSRLAT